MRIINALKSELFMRVYYFIFYLFKVKENRVIFISYGGNRYADSPKIISDYLHKYHKDKEIIWIMKNIENISKENIKVVKINSIKCAYYFYTSKYIFANSIINIRHKKGNQIYVQTWHGTPLKKIEWDAESKLSKRYLRKNSYNVKNMDFLLSGNKYTTEVFKTAFRVDKKILEIGTPRLDYLLNNTQSISSSKFIILFAPTFRNEESKNGDYQLSKIIPIDLLNLFEEKTGKKCELWIKFHPNWNSKKINISDSRIRNITDTIDMEKAMCKSNLLITDYSSSFFDFSILKKPVILYQYDLYDYIEERGIYMDMKDIPLFKIDNEKDFLREIVNINLSDLERKALEFLSYIENFEKGNSVPKLLEKIGIRKDN